MTATVILEPQPLATLLLDEMLRSQRIAVIIGPHGMDWRDELGATVTESVSPSRVRRRSSGYHTIELVDRSRGYIDVVTIRSVEGGALRGHTYDLVALPADSTSELRAAVLPTTLAVAGRIVQHEGLA